MSPPGVERLLRAHVAAVLAAAHVPRNQRSDLAEELYGHLVERWTSLVDEDVDPLAAAELAIESFGTPTRIGRDLTGTYHGQFWASTIGVLLPPARPTTAPQSVGAIALSVAVFLMSAVSLTSAVDMATGQTPVRAIVLGSAWAVGAAILFLVSQALIRGQRWAMIVSVAVCALAAVDGMAAYVRVPSALPLTGFVATASLLVAGLDRRGLWAATALGQRPPKILVGALSALLFASFSSGPLLAAMEDPTQASAENLAFEVGVQCDHVDERIVDGRVLRWTVDVFWEWSRTSMLPGGIRGWEQHTDAIVLRHPGDDWWLVTTRSPEEARSRRPVGWQGGGPPSSSAIPPNLAGTVVDVAIRTTDTHPSVRYQAVWVMHSQASTHDWPRAAEAWYFHGDRWSLVAAAACGERGFGVPGEAALP